MGELSIYLNLGAFAGDATRLVSGSLIQQQRQGGGGGDQWQPGPPPRPMWGIRGNDPNMNVSMDDMNNMDTKPTDDECVSPTEHRFTVKLFMMRNHGKHTGHL